MYKKTDNYKVMGRAGNSEIVFDQKNRKVADDYREEDRCADQGIEQESNPS